MILIIELILLFDTVSSLSHDANYTFWRYGNGDFDNILSKTQYLFSSGVFSSNVTIQSNLSFLDTNINQNKSNKIFYPLITENNEIFALRFGGINCVSNPQNEYKNYHIQNCELQLIKLTSNLTYLWNEIFISNISCNNPSIPCVNYPIYRTYNDKSYVIISFWTVIHSKHKLFTIQTYLYIIDVSNDMHNQIWYKNYDATFSYHDGQWNYQNQPILYQNYIYFYFYSLNNPQNEYYNITKFVYKLENGDIIWSSTKHDLYQTDTPLSSQQSPYRPIIFNNYIIVMETRPSFSNSSTPCIIAYDLFNGNQIWNTSNYFLQSGSNCNSVIHSKYSVLFTCIYGISSEDYAYVYILDAINGNVIRSFKDTNIVKTILLNEKDDTLIISGDYIIELYRINYISQGHVSLISLSNVSTNSKRYYYMDSSSAFMLLHTHTHGLNKYCYQIWNVTHNSLKQLPYDVDAEQNCDIITNYEWFYSYYNYPFVSNDNGLIYIISADFQIDGYYMGFYNKPNSTNNFKYEWILIYIAIGCGALLFLTCCLCRLYNKQGSKRNEREPILQKQSIN